MTAAEVVWEEPPPRRTGSPRPNSRVWTNRLAPFVANEGQWGVAYRTSPQKARIACSNLRKGRLILPAGKWEFTSRKVGDEGRVYARYLGGDAA